MASPLAKITSASLALLSLLGPASGRDQADLDLCRLGKDMERIAACTRLLSEKASSKDFQATARINRGAGYQQVGDYNNAILDYDQSIALKPGSAVAYFNRGLVWQKRHEFDKALTDFGEAIRLNSNFAGAYYNRGEVFRYQRRYVEAVADFNDAARIDPGNAAIYASRGYVRAIIGKDLQRALEDADQALELAGPNWITYDARGFVLLRMKRAGDAIRSYNAAIEMNPNSPSALYGRGIAKQIEGDKTADADISAAKKMQASIGDVFAQWGVVPLR